MSDRESASSRSSLSPGEARSPTPEKSRRMSDNDSPKPRSVSRSAESAKSGSRRSPNPRSRSRSPRRYRRSRSRGRRYYSRSRSRSPRYRDRKRRSRYTRSRSRSYSPDHRGRSPMSSRRRHVGNREAPRTSRCLGVFGLSLYTQERELREVFSRYGPVDEVNIVYDHQTGRSRGFCFLYMRNLDDAIEARERAPGMEIDGRKIRVDYSITERAHTPTPGIYLGKPSTYSRGYRGGGGGGGRWGRSPSPYYRGGGRSRYSRSRSRSRSYSPRRY